MGMKRATLIILKTFVVVFFSVFLFNELSGPRMSSADFGVVEKNVMKKMAAFKKAMQDRVDAQIHAFDGYGVEQVGLLKKAVISVDMNYAIYVTCDKANDVVSLYKEQL